MCQIAILEAFAGVDETHPLDGGAESMHSRALRGFGSSFGMRSVSERHQFLIYVFTLLISAKKSELCFGEPEF